MWGSLTATSEPCCSTGRSSSLTRSGTWAACIGYLESSRWTTRRCPGTGSLFPAVSCYLALPVPRIHVQASSQITEPPTPPSMELSGECRAGIRSIQSDFFPHQNHKVSTPERKKRSQPELLGNSDGSTASRLLGLESEDLMQAPDLLPLSSEATAKLFNFVYNVGTNCLPAYQIQMGKAL